MTPLDKEKIEKFAEALVTKMFRDFEKAKIKGPNFSWSKFPKMMENLARASVFASFELGKCTEEHEDYAGEFAFTLAHDVVKNNKNTGGKV